MVPKVKKNRKLKAVRHARVIRISLQTWSRQTKETVKHDKKSDEWVDAYEIIDISDDSD